MLSRREVLGGIVGSGASALVRGGIPIFATAAQPSTPVNFDVPANACDSHTHIFGDPSRYPFTVPRNYTPEKALVEEQVALHKALHITRVVIVNPTVYGSDNSCTLDSIKQRGRIARGIAVIDDKTSNESLGDMNRAGMRGIRLNIQPSGPVDSSKARADFQKAVDRVKTQPTWHIQIYTQLAVIEAIKDLVIAAPMPIVFDHFGGAQGPLGPSQAGFSTLLDLVHKDKVYVKISAPYRSSTLLPDYADVAPLAKALISANLRHIVWGSDWPHPNAPGPGHSYTDITPLWQVDDGRIFNQLPIWAPEPASRKAILVDNPAQLYGY